MQPVMNDPIRERRPTPYLSVIIPAYNEAQRIGPTLDDALAWLEAQALSWELIVVDDGSTDSTRFVVLDRIAKHPWARLLESRPNRGKGHAVRLGMLAARGELRLFMDADNSTPLSQLPMLLEAIDRGAQVAVGSRRAPGAKNMAVTVHGEVDERSESAELHGYRPVNEGRRPAVNKTGARPPWYRRWWSRLTNRVVRGSLVPGIRDTQCGFKLFTGAAASAIFPWVSTAGWGFDLEVLALAQRLGLGVAERPVAWTDDRRSRIHPLRDACRITLEFLRIRRAFRRGDYDRAIRSCDRLLRSPQPDRSLA